ncbi:TetR/AcrR family transcriptional regulator [Phenylobacterium montanum]|uniref:TetR/AcrR family transcriptional regulator n=1 Tax=Phenylobacterium montanum TaxID=2823693 RepID=A0A975G281_9CAUL|nr:TetR/AcrR family transcriptional regulator [Caulobacter sp. S6]QUD89212.1 TetR/AcrR family transcriptional regulator [Caulobacter sp. S6]
MSKDGYHHGDLRRALIEAALAVVEQAGAEAVSLRELAEQAGVSRAAPYRHFADRDELLACVAARGFEDLNAGYEAALAAPGDGRERLRRASLVYVDFAARRPGLFKLMFESDLLAPGKVPAVMVPAANQSYYLLWRAVEGADPSADDKTVKARTITLWSTLYGFLALDGAGRFKPFMTEPLTREEIVEAVVSAATRG